MIYLRLAGGLGNQLFQLAAALAFARWDKFPVTVWTGSLRDYDVKRHYEADKLFDDLGAVVRTGPMPLIPKIALRSRVVRMLPLVGVNDRNFRSMLGEWRGDRLRPTLLMDGYFQNGWSWSAFSDVRSKLLEIMNPFHGELRERVDCALHLRGGDFLNFPSMNILNAHYYARAIGVLRQSTPISVVHVVTDDPLYARNMCDVISELVSGVQFVQPTARYSMREDFELLRTARARILCNSTFSWWAAALDDQESPTLTPDHWTASVPKNWFLPWETSLHVAGANHSK